MPFQQTSFLYLLSLLPWAAAAWFYKQRCEDLARRAAGINKHVVLRTVTNVSYQFSMRQLLVQASRMAAEAVVAGGEVPFCILPDWVPPPYQSPRSDPFFWEGTWRVQWWGESYITDFDVQIFGEGWVCNKLEDSFSYTPWEALGHGIRLHQEHRRVVPRQVCPPRFLLADETTHLV